MTGQVRRETAMLLFFFFSPGSFFFVRGHVPYREAEPLSSRYTFFLLTRRALLPPGLGIASVASAVFFSFLLFLAVVVSWRVRASDG
ncbi:hypothetical protein BDZ88DRAFT_403800 [Geranomyces variabilis]|nr:hypothetical protein BDZ88DRAFT_403800 [Geranomyces variabilis]